MHLIVWLPALLVTPSHGQEPSQDELLAEREATLGLERFYETATDWHYALEVDTPQYEERGPIVWRYDGQQVFSDDPPTITGSVTFVEPDFVLTGIEFDPEGYFAALAVDAYGRRWVVDTVDLVAVADLAADGVLLSDSGGETGDTGLPAGPDGIPGIELNPDGGTQHVVELTGWTLSECIGNLYAEHDGNGPLVQQTVDGLAADRNLVSVLVDNKGCSGALVDTDAVLTAAHCLTDAFGNLKPLGSMSVCTMENLQVNSNDGLVPGCYDVSQVAVATGWTGGHPYDVTKDWALIFLEEEPELGPSHEYMQLSNTTDAFVAGQSDHLDGYPAADPVACQWNRVSDSCDTVDHTRPGRHLWKAEGTVAGTPVGYMKYHTSFEAGLSGAPHYYCFPDCWPATISGVQAASENMCGGAVGPCATGFGIGPKSRDIKLAVDTLLASTPNPVDDCPTLAEVPFVAPVPTRIDPSEMSPTCSPGASGSSTTICEDILVFRPNGATQQNCNPWQRDSKVVVYLPGTESYPDENLFPLEMAAYGGYRTIGLSYANWHDVGPWCKNRAKNYGGEVLECADPTEGEDYRDECLYYARKERITGIDDARTSYDPTKDDELEYQYYDQFPVEDSILYRLFYTLLRMRDLDVGDNGVDDCGWGPLFDDDDGNIHLEWNAVEDRYEITGFTQWSMDMVHWDRIILGGWSQGSGHATLIALEQQVAGLFLLDGASDMCLEDWTNQGSGRPSTYYSDLVDGVLEPSSGAPRFGVWHTRSGVPDDSQLDDARPVSWDNTYPDPEHDTPLRGLRMQMCDDQAWDETASEAVSGGNTPRLTISRFPAIAGETASYRSMALETDQDWPVVGGCGPHESVAMSAHGFSCMPVEGHPIPPNAPAAATSADQAQLFEAYVQAFCELGEAQ